MKKIIYPILLIVLCSLALASFTSLGYFKQGQDINIIQTCANCTFNNITSIRAPDGTPIIENVVMTKIGSEYNYTLSGSSTNDIGQYFVNGLGDPDGTNEIWAYNFDVTKSGSRDILDDALVWIYIMMLGFCGFLIWIGISREDGWAILLAGFLLVASGVYLYINGISTLNDQLTSYISILFIAFGVYIGFRGIEATGFGEAFPRMFSKE